MLIREAQDKLEEGKSLHLISQVFTEIASSKLKRIRRGIEQNRYFFYDLTNIYSLINMIALKNNLSHQSSLKKTAVILVGSNERFYGQINDALISFFLKNTANKNYDRFIIGKTAHAYLESISYPYQYKKIVLTRDLPERDEIQNLTNQIKDYSQVLVFYPQMKSVLSQVPIFKDITQSGNLANFGSNKKALAGILGQLDYLLEPDIKIMLQFFDTQIKGLLLDQTFLESELARTASRLVTMDQAQNEAVKYIKEIQIELVKAKKNAANSKIIEVVSVLELLKRKQS